MFKKKALDMQHEELKTLAKVRFEQALEALSDAKIS